MPRRPVRPATALLAALALACLVVGGLWWWQSHFEAGVMDGSIPSDLAFDTLDDLRRGLSMGVALCLAALGAVVGWMAWNVHREGRWPPGSRNATPLAASRRRWVAASLGIAGAVTLLAAAALAFSA